MVTAEQEGGDGVEKFIDIHCHLLHGVDDGATDLEDAKALLRMAWEDGVGTVVLTPHYRGRFRQNTPEDLARALAELERCKPEGMELFLGNEVSFEPDVSEKLREGRVLTLAGGPYVLLEFSVLSTAAQVLAGVEEILSGGMIPVIAHAERYPVFLKDRRLVGTVLHLGALIQINAESIMGEDGLAVKWFCRRLLKDRCVHFVASDAHDQIHRTPRLGDCYRLVRERYGKEYADALFRENARVVLSQ